LAYKNRLSSDLQIKISKFFDNVAPQDKDFGRRWKMNDWFNDDDDIIWCEADDDYALEENTIQKNGKYYIIGNGNEPEEEESEADNV
jgi:hypothetical protein